ncbi:hypothetical protein Ddc_16810 [Ditylenchus destructor]|nr:hypothetical protein Ddc_16810 [Ditylenchus destructor]
MKYYFTLLILGLVPLANAFSGPGRNNTAEKERLNAKILKEFPKILAIMSPKDDLYNAKSPIDGLVATVDNILDDLYPHLPGYADEVLIVLLVLYFTTKANSRQLKADLELAKVSIGELTVSNEKLADELSAKSAECEKVSELYKKSLISRPRNVRKTFMNFPGSSSVMTAANSNTVDLNTVIDLTKDDSDDEIPSSSKKRK